MERLKQQMQFILEVDKLKDIIRQTYISSGQRKETDAEHSFSLALMVLLLSEYSNEPIDVQRTMMMTLVHDIVEVDAGDTYAYDDTLNVTKREREVKAASRIFNMLPKDQAVYLRELWDEFEALETPESKFANAIDKIQPMLLNDFTDGRAWREHEVKISKILKRNEHTHEGSEKLWQYMQTIIHKNVIKGNIKEE